MSTGSNRSQKSSLDNHASSPPGALGSASAWNATTPEAEAKTEPHSDDDFADTPRGRDGDDKLPRDVADAARKRIFDAARRGPRRGPRGGGRGGDGGRAAAADGVAAADGRPRLRVPPPRTRAAAPVRHERVVRARAGAPRPTRFHRSRPRGRR